MISNKLRKLSTRIKSKSSLITNGSSELPLQLELMNHVERKHVFGVSIRVRQKCSYAEAIQITNSSCFYSIKPANKNTDKIVCR